MQYVKCRDNKSKKDKQMGKGWHHFMQRVRAGLPCEEELKEVEKVIMADWGKDRAGRGHGRCEGPRVGA